MNDNEELIRKQDEVKAAVRQLSSQMAHMSRELAKISGGLAVVLNRSEENRLELAETKKKLTHSPPKYDYTRSVLHDWRLRRRLPQR